MDSEPDIHTPPIATLVAGRHLALQRHGHSAMRT
jgi:hypothetical protein